MPSAPASVGPLRPRKPNDWDAVDVSERGANLFLLDDVAEETSGGAQPAGQR